MCCRNLNRFLEIELIGSAKKKISHGSDWSSSDESALEGLKLEAKEPKYMNKNKWTPPKNYMQVITEK